MSNNRQGQISKKGYTKFAKSSTIAVRIFNKLTEKRKKLLNWTKRLIVIYFLVLYDCRETLKITLQI